MTAASLALSLPTVCLGVRSALVEAGLRSVLSGVGFTLLTANSEADAPQRAEVWIVDDAALEDPDALAQFPAVVTLGSVVWASLLPDLGLSGWAALPADATAAELIAGVLSAAAGLAALPSEGIAALQAAEEAPDPKDPDEDPDLADIALTPRESDVLELLAAGLSNKRAARELGVTESTVKFHLQAIYSKLGVGNRAAAVSRGIQLGLVRI